MAALLFRDKKQVTLVEQPVEMKNASSYPIPLKRHNLVAGQLLLWVKAQGAAIERLDGDIHEVLFYAPPPNRGVTQCLGHWLYSDLVLINCAGSAKFAKGMGWSMNFMPIRTDWVPQMFHPWFTGAVGLPTAPVSSAEILGPGDVVPPTVRATRYITPRAQRTAICPCGVHHSQCNLHGDWLTVD
jgi:hypothetical protein